MKSYTIITAIKLINIRLQHNQNEQNNKICYGYNHTRISCNGF